MWYLVIFMALAHPESLVDFHEEEMGKVAKVADLPGPINLNYQFEVSGRRLNLAVSSDGLEGDFFAEAKNGELLTLNPDDAWNKIRRSNLDGELVDEVILPNPPGAFNALFTTSTGAIIGKATNNQLYRGGGGSWQNTGASAEWLGSRSVSESSGVIMLAEYCSDTSLVGRILRSTDDGLTWQAVLTKRALGDSNPEIRHFHMVVKDPYQNAWYAFSGDGAPACRVWKSRDDGESWLEVTDVNGDQGNVDPLVHTQSLHRATSVWFTPDWIVWGTDDRLGGSGSRLVRTPRTEPFNLSVVGDLAVNHIRTAIEYPGFGHLLFTENVSGYAGIELVFVTNDLQIVPVGVIEGINSYFTSSVASLVAEPFGYGLTAFSLARGVAIPYRTLRYTLTDIGPGERPPGVPLLTNLGCGILVGLLFLVGGLALERKK